ncbi:hypothetical protein GF360_03840 [candidate division WWE3 bacterium]|nr:hypothetical protein [candidate division WWE3 bacterium]
MERMSIMTQKAVFKEISKIVKKHLPKGDYSVFVFGSRATNTSREYSDIDVGIEGDEKLPLSTIGFMKEDLEKSSIPYTVDVVDFSRVSAHFKDFATKNTIKL